MNAYLLDTHIFIWAISESRRLSDGIREMLHDRNNVFFVSPVTAWEIANKHRLGKLPGVEVIILRFEEHVSTFGARQLPISTHHALVAGSLEWPHRDPFDRFLAAQALAENLTLVSADQAFSTLGGLKLLSS